MLIMSRKIEEGIRIGGTIEIKVLDIYSTDKSGSRKSKIASIGITAPRELTILRKELVDTVRQNQEAEKSARNLSGAALGGILKQKRKLTTPE